MFTRCPDCLTVFHISAAELRAADGAVVCGECNAKFDALASLSETLPTDPPRSLAGMMPVETVAEPSAAGEDAAARDEEDFLEELESLIGPEDTGAEAETAQEAAGEPDDEPGEAGSERVLPAVEPEAQQDWEPEDELDDAVEEDWEDHAGGEPTPWEDDDLADELGEELDEELAEELGEELAAESETTPVFITADEPEPAEALEEDAGREADEPYVGDDTLEPDELREFAALQPQRRRWPLVLVVLLAALVVGGAWAHSQRGTLLRHPMGAAVLGPVYELLGLEATARWSPADFQALKWEAEADPAQPERLIVAVEFVNSAAFAQPYPLLRVVLEDRFGRRVGSHDVGPAEYLEGYARGRRLPAGSRVRATVEVPDPGARAEGFRIDFCLESGAQGLVCSTDGAR